MPWISRIAGPGSGDPERPPVAVDGAELQRRASARARGADWAFARVTIANSVVGPGVRAASSKPLRCRRLVRWNSSPVCSSEEPLELRAEFVAAGQVFVMRQQGPVLLCSNERIVLALQRGHHLSDLRAGLDLLVDLGRAPRRPPRQAASGSSQRTGLGDLRPAAPRRPADSRSAPGSAGRAR